MRFYQQLHRFYGGVDWHARSMYLCIVDDQGGVHWHENFEPAMLTGRPRGTEELLGREVPFSPREGDQPSPLRPPRRKASRGRPRICVWALPACGRSFFRTTPTRPKTLGPVHR